MKNPCGRSTLWGVVSLFLAASLSLAGCSSSSDDDNDNTDDTGSQNGDATSIDLGNSDVEGDTSSDSTTTPDESDPSDTGEPDSVADSTEEDTVEDSAQPDETDDTVADSDVVESDVVPDETTDTVADIVPDEAADEDTGETCQPALAVRDDGGGAEGAVGVPNLVISEVRPAEFIELFNTTGRDIDLSGTTHAFCSPFLYADLADLHAPGEESGSVTVPAGGFATVDWPVTSRGQTFPDDSDGGEILLYSNASFSTDTAILDFVCWGTSTHGSRQDQAVAVSKWGRGNCAPALREGSIHRLPETTGDGAASYNVTRAGSPSNFTP